MYIALLSVLLFVIVVLLISFFVVLKKYKNLKAEMRDLFIDTENEEFNEEPAKLNKTIKINKLDKDFVNKTVEIITSNINENDLSVEMIAEKVFLSRSQLYRKIKIITGKSVNDLIRDVRLDKAKELIMLGNSNINEISYKVGFSSASYFTKCYKNKFGHLPTVLYENEVDST